MSTRINGVENLPTLPNTGWYVPPGASAAAGSVGSSGSSGGSRGSFDSGAGFDPLNGRHRVRRRRRSEQSGDGGSGSGGEMSEDDEGGGGRSGAETDSGSESGSDSGSDESGSDSDSEDEFFEATDVQRKWRRLSLTTPNTPFEDTPTLTAPGGGLAPATAEVSAKFYSEAYLTGIPPTHADAAAKTVHASKKWWSSMQATTQNSSSSSGNISNLDSSAHGGSVASVSSGANSAAERGEASPRALQGGWSHTGDAAVTASLVPELKAFALPTVESIFGTASTAPQPFDGSLHAMGLTMKRNLDAELGLGHDQGGHGVPPMAPSSTSGSTPTSSRRGSSSRGGSTTGSSRGCVTEDEVMMTDVYDDAASHASARSMRSTLSGRSIHSARSIALSVDSDGSVSSAESNGSNVSSQDEEKGFLGSRARRSGNSSKRSRKFSRFSTAIQDDKETRLQQDKDLLDYKEFPEMMTTTQRDQLQLQHGDDANMNTVEGLTQLEKLDALRSRVCSPDLSSQESQDTDEPLTTDGQQLTEAEFQDCLEEISGEGGEDCEPVIDPFEDEDGSQVQPAPAAQAARQVSRLPSSNRRRRSSAVSRQSSRGSYASTSSADERHSEWRTARKVPQVSPQGKAMITSGPHPTPLQVVHARRLAETKSSLLRHLSASGGDVTNANFLTSLTQLRSLANQTGMDAIDYASDSSRALEGMWLTLSRPNYHDCLGKNTHRTSTNPSSGSSSEGEYMYTLGRMSFDMFRPTNLVNSVQGVFNPCHRVDGQKREEVESVPRGLRREIEDGETCLRTYNIVTAFTVETPPSSSGPAASQGPSTPPAPDLSGNAHVRKPIRGIQTTYGYVLPDPQTPNRLSVWFTGGTLECNDLEEDGDEWRHVFLGDQGGNEEGGGHGDTNTKKGGALPKRKHLSERARVLAAKLLLGATLPERMEDDGTMAYRLTRPIGGHGTAYIDVLYLDETLRILRGHHGTLYVFARVPGED